MKRLLTILLFMSLLTACKQGDQHDIVITDNLLIVEESLEHHSIGKKLIPKGCVKGLNDTHEIELIYYLSLGNEVEEDIALEVSINEVLIGFDETYSHLVRITFLGEYSDGVVMLGNDKVELHLLIELVEPVNSQEVYNSVNGSDITFDIVFKRI